MPADEAALSSVCPFLTKMPIHCTEIFSEGARCTAQIWPSVSSVYPNGGLGPVDGDPCRLPQALGHGDGDGRCRLAIALNPGSSKQVALARACRLCKTQHLACPQALQLATEPKARWPGSPWAKAALYLLLHSAKRLTVDGVDLSLL